MVKPFHVLGEAGRTLLGRKMAGRGVTVFPDDIFLVSYPRSGNTWTRFLIGNLISDEPVTFANIESRIPEIYFNPDHKMRRLPKPRVLKSHECFQPHYKRIIYIVRDPRDVAVSFYHHNIKAGNIPENYPLDNFVPRFIEGEFDVKWGSWADHVTSWLTLRQNNEHFLLLRYERMKEDPAAELMRVASFMERCGFRKIDVTAAQLQKTIELSSPQHMRELEKLQGRQWALTKNTRHDKPFVRTATPGGWKKTLPSQCARQIEAAWGPIMRSSGL